MHNKDVVLQMDQIEKRFGGTYALKGVDLTLKKGEVLGLIGENGAGKSTLMKILSGVYKKDSGQIYLNGKETEIVNAENAQNQGISIIYQELSVFLNLNVIENIFIHREKTIGNNSIFSFFNTKEMEKSAKRIFNEQLKINLDLKKKASELTLAQRQLVEIARSLCSEAQIIIMDEPTTALETTEIKHLFEIIKNLKKNGTSIIYVSHQLEEVLGICDRVMVLRDGKKVADTQVEQLDINKIITYMIGKTLKQQYPKEKVNITDTLLEVKNLSKKGQFKSINFELSKGEILGIAGLEGCGKYSVVRTIFGILQKDYGQIVLKGKNLEIKKIEDAKRNNIAFVPAERKTEGVFLENDVRWNLSIASLDRMSNIIINSKKEIDFSNKYVQGFGIKTESINHPISSLSGGNQQKVMLARWMMTEPDLLILEEPTRGIDVNAKAEVYKLIIEFVKKGNSVIVVSSEAPELLGICDRIMVMHNGEISGMLNANEATEETIAYYSVSHKGDKKSA